MQVNQVYQILNTMTQEIIGDSIIVAEDLSNVVDVGKAFSGVSGAVDNYVRKLPDHIGKVIVVDRVYSGRAPRVLRDGWDFGATLEKIRISMPEAQENESWELQDGQSYDPNIVTLPTANVKFFNGRVTFEVPMTITRKMVMSSFSSATQLNAFYSAIETAIENSISIKMDSLIMRTINAAIGETFYADFPGGTYTGSSGVKAVNLLYLYNQRYGTSLSAANAVTQPEFIRFASYVIKNYAERMKTMSTLFNVGGTEKFTPTDKMHIVLLSEFANAADVFLYDGTGQFKDDRLRLPDAEVVPFWQGSGTGYAFADTSAINITTPGSHVVSASGILGVIFDHDALGVANLERQTTTQYNGRADFWNEWHKYTAGHFLDLDENFVVFYVAAA